MNQPTMKILRMEESTDPKGSVILRRWLVLTGGAPSYVAVTYPGSLLLTVYRYAGLSGCSWAGGRNVKLGAARVEHLRQLMDAYCSENEPRA